MTDTTVDINFSYTSENRWVVNPTVNPNQAIVLHGTAGGLQPSLHELLYGQGSSNYVISKAGVIYCLVNPYSPYNFRSWCNGIFEYPDLTNELIRTWYQNGINPNLRTITIEHEQLSFDMTNRNYAAFTPKQAEASKKLVRKLCKDFGIPIARTHILGHFQFMRYSRAYCPGVIDISRFIDGVKGMAESNNNDEQFFRETGFSISNIFGNEKTGFLDYWRKLGLKQLGFPIGAPYKDMEQGGRIVQYTERARLEYHPQNPTEYKVLEGLLGSEILALKREIHTLKTQNLQAIYTAPENLAVAPGLLDNFGNAVKSTTEEIEGI